jgi:thiamine-monophosphate kinase
MVEGTHFFAETDPWSVGHKLLAVNLSDLAAMGAEPVSVTLALTIPKVDEDWLTGFSQGFLNLAKKFSVDLIGGDTTTGALTLTVQAMGLIPEGLSMRRSTAKVGDLIFVTGKLGEAGLGLKIETGYLCNFPEAALNQFHRPEPKVMEAMAIRNYANACIDLSDGIASDLKHILKKSSLGATLDWDKIPLSRQVEEYISSTGDWEMPLSAGDDYELCFTVSPDKIDLIHITCTQVGVIEAETGLRNHRCGETKDLEAKGFEHFS